MATAKHESDKQRFRLYVHPCPRFITGGNTHAFLGCSRRALLRRALSPTFPAVWVPPLLRQSFSPSSPARSSAHSLGMEARSEKVSSTPREGTAFALSSSDEEGGASVNRDEAVDLPPQSVLFEELW